MKLKFPKYVWICFVLMIVFQFLTYYLSQLLTYDLYHYDFTIYGFDDKVPFIAIFIVPYILAYPFWALTPFILGKLPKDKYISWAITALIHYVIFFIIYVFVPTTITRPVVSNDNIFNYLVNLIYILDSPELPSNLFPSLHCSLSILCYIGVMCRKEFPKWYRIFSLIFAILVCMSTQFIKQHYIVDFISALVITVAAHMIVTKFKLYRFFIKKETVENGN